MLEDKGVPGMVERTLIRPPSSRLARCDPRPTRRGDRRLADGGQVRGRARPDIGHEMLAARAAAAAAKETAEAGEEDRPGEREFNAARRYSGSARAAVFQAGATGFASALGIASGRGGQGAGAPPAGGSCAASSAGCSRGGDAAQGPVGPNAAQILAQRLVNAAERRMRGSQRRRTPPG